MSVNNDVGLCVKCSYVCTSALFFMGGITMFVLGTLALNTNCLPGVSTGGAYAMAVLGGGTVGTVAFWTLLGIAATAVKCYKKCTN